MRPLHERTSATGDDFEGGLYMAASVSSLGYGSSSTALQPGASAGGFNAAPLLQQAAIPEHRVQKFRNLLSKPLVRPAPRAPAAQAAGMHACAHGSTAPRRCACMHACSRVLHACSGQGCTNACMLASIAMGGLLLLTGA